MTNFLNGVGGFFLFCSQDHKMINRLIQPALILHSNSALYILQCQRVKSSNWTHFHYQVRGGELWIIHPHCGDQIYKSVLRKVKKGFLTCLEDPNLYNAFSMRDLQPIAVFRHKLDFFSLFTCLSLVLSRDYFLSRQICLKCLWLLLLEIRKPSSL